RTSRSVDRIKSFGQDHKRCCSLPERRVIARDERLPACTSAWKPGLGNEEGLGTLWMLIRHRIDAGSVKMLLLRNAGFLDHVGPFLDVVGEPLADFFRRAGTCLDAKLGESVLDRRVRQHLNQ